MEDLYRKAGHSYLRLSSPWSLPSPKWSSGIGRYRAEEISAITTAAYTFYKAVMAIIHLVRAHRHGGPVAQALRAVNIADACISMVSLTVLLIATFGDGAGMIAMKASVGFGAVAVTAAMAAGILVSGIRSLRRVRAAESTAADGEAEGFR